MLMPAEEATLLMTFTAAADGRNNAREKITHVAARGEVPGCPSHFQY
jgi:hypothetical protein